ncbi:hypothetical protein GF342_05490 [Candidatus Woesearchaeota archaeon]|nr:hypothetical protein [Candidatus Woesearchaeota archaeon]
MRYEDLRNAVIEHPKYEDCVSIDRAPLLTPGFPGTFNLSFTEDPWLKEYGRYVDFDRDYTFSTIQSCIRPQDTKLLGTEDSWKYLGVFEMSDLTGMINLAERLDPTELVTWQIHELVSFFTSLGIPPDRVHPSYCKGGKVGRLTNGKYSFDREIHEDRISRNAFLSAKVPERNLIPDKSRDTFLALHVHRPTPWGYRNEVNVDIGERGNPKLLDVATVEYLLWAPVFRGDETSKNIVGLRDLDCSVFITGIGLERLGMAMQGVQRVQDVDYLRPFYQGVEELTGGKDYLAAESLRALHRIYSDVVTRAVRPGKKQKEKIRMLIRNVGYLELSIRELLKVHSMIQPWHPDLNEGMEPTIERIRQYREAKSGE